MSKKFRKIERLCSQKEIDSLFVSGNSFFLYPFRVVWKRSIFPDNVPVKITIAVPKRRFKKAVSRNLIKRRIRESYRQQKSQLYENLLINQEKIVLMLIYTADEVLSSDELYHKISLLIKRFPKELELIK